MVVELRPAATTATGLTSALRSLTIRIRLAVTSHGRRRRVVAEITDDGRGMGSAPGTAQPADSASSGFGMTVMCERAARWGGTVRVLSPATGGTCVRLSLPLPTSLPTRPAPDERMGS
jgi:signal transduction histidine kinase